MYINKLIIFALMSCMFTGVAKAQSISGSTTQFAGSKSGGTAAISSSLSGAIYNSSAPTLTNGQQVSLQSDVSGYLDINQKASLFSGSASGGTAATSSNLGGAIYNSSAPTLTTGQQAALQLDASGNLKVNITTTTGSTVLSQGYVTTSPPTYSTTTQQSLSLDTAGNLRTSMLTALPAGTNSIGYVPPLDVATTQASFTSSGSANTFTQALAANTSRKGCSVQYNGTGTAYVFFGSGTASLTNSFILQGGQTADCSHVGSNLVADDAVQVASSNTSDAFVTTTQ